MVETFFIAFGGFITALGGWEFVKHLLNRKTENRKAEAEADNAELETLRKQYDWLQQKYEAVSKKLDGLYAEFRELENRNVELLKRNGELELALKVAQYNVCERPDDECIRRLPSREKCRLKKLLSGEYELGDKENNNDKKEEETK